MQTGPFVFHLTEKTVRAILPALPENFTPADIRAALLALDAEEKEDRRATERGYWRGDR